MSINECCVYCFAAGFIDHVLVIKMLVVSQQKYFLYLCKFNIIIVLLIKSQNIECLSILDNFHFLCDYDFFSQYKISLMCLPKNVVNFQSSSSE